jgi:DNA-binding CsgD family transcriptional regulator/tetratricopeptide (TPR) repeat protein
VDENGFVRSRGTSPRFVGRAAELLLFDELFGEMRAGQPVTALICGEAGAGKTRLVSEVAAAARRRGARTLVGCCSMVGRTSLALAPFAEALRPVMRELVMVTRDAGGRVAPQLARLLAAPMDAAEANRGSPDPDPVGAADQLRLFEEVLDILARAAVPAGLLVVIEDLHWADLSSRGLFEFMSRNLRGAPIVLVGTVRTDEPDEAGFLAWLAELRRSRRVASIDLERFGPGELADLLAGVLGRSPSAELVGEVYGRSGGNAFLAEELVAALERGVQVPNTVRSVVLARMAGLTAPARELLRLAAVAGIRIRHGLLAAASGLRHNALLAAARELTDNHVLVADPSWDGYVFRHALTREAVYDDLLPGERQQLHRSVAVALSDDPNLGPPEAWAVAQAVAEHWFAAGELEPALAAAVAAGNAAREVAAVADALGHYERVLELWDRVADPEMVAGMERPGLLERAAEVASGAGEHDLAIRHIDAAISELEDAAAAPAQLGLLYAQKCLYIWRAGREGELLEWTARAVALVPSEPPTRGRAAVLGERASALATLGERYEEAAQVATAALEAARKVDAPKEEARAHTALGICLGMTSTDPEDGIREFERVIAIGREIGDAEEVVSAYANLADELVRLGRLDEAAATAVEATDVGVEMGALRSWVGLSMVNRAEALFLAGRWGECEQQLVRLRDQRVGGLAELWGLVLTALLEASRGRDDAAAAASATAESLGVDDAQANGLLGAARAQMALNSGDIRSAHRAAVDGLDALTGSLSQQEMAGTTLLAGLALRIEADRAELARARRDATDEQDAIESARSIASRTLDLRARACAAAHRPEVVRAHRALCEAELSRAQARRDPEKWLRVATAGPAAGEPHRRAYARFREAEAVLATRGDRTRAVQALTAADLTARQLGAEPLRQEIEALARRARIELIDQPRPSAAPLEPGLATLGLSPRELEVLQLLAAGYTNPQIGEALYVSRKTASHHVSSILTKLGVRTRVEAAGVAHRLGMGPDAAAPK